MIVQWINEAEKELAAAGVETPRLDAELLLAHVLGCERFELYLAVPGQPSAISKKKFDDYIERRIKREPVAYIIGCKEFWSILIKVTPDVLIPRPETEAVVEKALKLSGHRTILDLCTGSGCIAAALATEFPQAHITVVDISKEALTVAKENLKFAGDRITFVEGNLFENVRGQFDLIVSNPPYIPTSICDTLMPEVKFFEPRRALDGGANGLDFVEKIRQYAPNFLKPDGHLILENGPEIETWTSSSLKAAFPFTA
ncbi:MAG: peptide chain release factor N(5)-glutamine methyltransferase [Deltaproteobacteria bacterium]|nr:peptide chain release factor N(5)-glutamine methyltransferase [Deltaproteobacteria bacterium]